MGRVDWQMDMGATPSDGSTVFRVWAPAATSVDVVVDGTPNPMQRERDGLWCASVRDATPESSYRFRLNGADAFPDPYSRSQPDGVHGPSQVVDPRAFEWHDSGWRGLDIDGLVIYQCHVGTATPEGTFDALIGQLPRLKALGVTAVEPLPVAEFPGARNWGYDGVDLFAPAHVYGGPDGFKRLIDAAHAEGLGIILDVVYNHFGPDGNYLRQFSPDYFTNRYSTPWGDAINYDGQNSEYVRRFVLDNARYWLTEYHADGLRLDATHAIYDSSKTHILTELSEAARTSVNKSIVLIAETHENDVRYFQPTMQGGFGMDAVWADEFHHILRRHLAGDHEAYFARYSGTLQELAECINRGWIHGTDASHEAPPRFVYVIQNHDQVGNRAMGERLHHQIDMERYRAAATLLLFLPYTPMLFMGQEFAASSPFQYFTDHNPELGKLVTAGRRKEFAGFSAFANPARREQIPDPQAESTFLRSKLALDEASAPPGADVAELYRALLRLRHEDEVLRDQSREHTEARALDDEVLAVRRWHDGQERLLLVNFGDTQRQDPRRGLAAAWEPQDPRRGLAAAWEPQHLSGFGEGWQTLLSSGAHADGGALPARTAVVLKRSVA
ncbi:MAG: malto-oligosyltrehalose trehalohydrolase [Chloroflexi bacterium]|nr:malto-oligosyltrehalose trehalohydrolase [Chloroflexota bacterium]